jgi:hypothetical protein
MGVNSPGNKHDFPLSLVKGGHCLTRLGGENPCTIGYTFASRSRRGPAGDPGGSREPPQETAGKPPHETAGKPPHETPGKPPQETAGKPPQLSPDVNRKP